MFEISRGGRRARCNGGLPHIVLAHPCSPLRTLARPCAPLRTLCSPLRTLERPLLTLAHPSLLAAGLLLSKATMLLCRSLPHCTHLFRIRKEVGRYRFRFGKNVAGVSMSNLFIYLFMTLCLGTVLYCHSISVFFATLHRILGLVLSFFPVHLCQAWIKL